jgi:hypothetical protein
MTRYSEEIYFKEDLIKAYSEKRKDISYSEVEDLVNSLVSYLKKTCRKQDTYEIELGSVGILHKKIDYDLYEAYDLSKSKTLNTKMMIQEALNSNTIFSPKKENKSREEIQRHTNASED